MKDRTYPPVRGATYGHLYAHDFRAAYGTSFLRSNEIPSLGFRTILAARAPR